MSHYGQFCPVALGAEIFAERWTPLLVRELLYGPKRFSEVHRGVPRISKNLLVQRLESLERSGIISRRPATNGRGHLYELSESGRELGKVVEALGTWGYRWASKDLADEHLDPDFLMWAVRRMVRVEALPDNRVVVLFRFRKYDDRQFWLVLQRPEVDLCLFDPGYEVNLTLDAEVEAMARVCLGHVAFLQMVRDRRIEITGPPRHRRALADWLGVTRFAALAKSAAQPTAS